MILEFYPVHEAELVSVGYYLMPIIKRECLCWCNDNERII